MRRNFICRCKAKLLLFLFLIANSGHLLQAHIEQGHLAGKGQETQPNSTIYSGRLQNGLRFILVQRRSEAFEDSSRVAIRMRVAGGWQAEASGESGLSHLIEHLARAANGALSPKEVAAFRDKRTVIREWGAFTSPYSTEYFLTTLSNDENAIGDAFSYFVGIARNMRFSNETVDRERRVVMNEMADRLPLAERLYRRARALNPGSEWDVSRGYDSTDVPTAGLEAITELYQRVYRPENVTFIIVGDIETTTIERLLRLRFGDWSAEKAQPARVEVDSADTSRKLDIKKLSSSREEINSRFTTAPDVWGSPAVLIGFRTDFPAYFAGRTNIPRRESAVLYKVISHILHHRLKLRSIEAGLVDTSFMIDDTAEGLSTFLWQSASPNGEWRDVLAILLDQFEAARTGGFTQRELAIAKRLVRRQHSDHQDQALSYSNSNVSTKISFDMIRRYRVLSDEDRLSAEGRFLDTVTLETLNSAWRAHATNFTLQARLEGFEENATSILHSDLAAFVANYDPKPLSVLGYPEFTTITKFGPSSGVIINDETTVDGIRNLTFKNGAVLRLINRNHEGKLLEIAVSAIAPRARADLTFCDAQTLPPFIVAGGTTKHNASQIINGRWGRDVRLSSFEVTPSGLAITASVRHDDVAYAFRELFGYFSNPAFNQSGNEVALAQVRQRRIALDRNPVNAILGAYERSLEAIGSEYGPVSEVDCAGGSNMKRAALKLHPILSRSQINVAVSGNISENEIIDLFARSFGQDRRENETFEPSSVAREIDPDPKAFIMPADNRNHEIVGIAWPLPRVSDADDLANQNILVSLLARMAYVKLVERGSSYAPHVERRRLNFQKDTFAVVFAVATPKGNASDILAAMGEVADDLVNSPIDFDLFETARNLVIDGDKRSYNEDKVWAYLAAQLTSDPDVVANWRSSAEATNRVSADAVRELAGVTLLPPIPQPAWPVTIE
ncbi:MAG: insulinase family protein [Erythrobacter sp.]|jgi:zinc protease|nr:insulinase family protein [Erythrobacter sp.]